MLNRVVDISLIVSPQKPGSPSLLPFRLPRDIEPTGEERFRKVVQRQCMFQPYQIGDNTEDVAMDIILGDSMPHTHAESLWLNEVTVLNKIPKNKLWTIRDIATVPAAEFTREASIINLSNEDLCNNKITKDLLKKYSQHVDQGDFVLIRTDFNKRYNDADHLPEFDIEAANWLINSKHIVGLGMDIPIYGSVPEPNGIKIHTYFYQNAVLMIDEMKNFNKIPNERFLFCGGLSLRTTNIGSSPARPIVLPLQGNKWDKPYVDLFQSIEQKIPSPPYERIEPSQNRGDLNKRFRIKWLQISYDRETESLLSQKGAIRPQRDFGSPVRIFSNHLGTYIRYSKAKQDTSNLIAKGKLFNVNKAGPKYKITLSDIKKISAKVNFSPGEAVVIRTGYSDSYYYRPDYLKWSPTIEPDVIYWLSKEGAKFIVADIAALDENGVYGDTTRAIEEEGLPSVLCASDLWRINKEEFQVVCSPIPLDDLSISPCRVVCIETWE